MSDFSKWVEAGAIAKKTTDQVKRWFWESIVCRFGVPGEEVTDNNAEFKRNFTALLANCDTTYHNTSTRHHQATAWTSA